MQHRRCGQNNLIYSTGPAYIFPNIGEIRAHTTPNQTRVLRVDSGFLFFATASA